MNGPRPAAALVCLVALAASLCGLGCADPVTIDVTLVTPSVLVPATTFTSLRVRVSEASSGRVVKESNVPMTALGAPAELFDADGLDEGARYVATVIAQSSSCARLGRAVGRSLPFTHRAEPYSISVQIGCADELNPTRRQPVIGRVGQAIVAMPSGEALIVGGARSGTLIPLRALDLASEVERYDITMGQFSITTGIATARTFPAAAALPSGEVTVIGGTLPDITGCSGAIDVVAGSSAASVATLANPRCFPAAAFLREPGRVVVVGGARPIEIYDATMRTRVSETTPSLALRNLPTALALDDGASLLVIGGTTAEAPSDGPPVELIRVGGGCGDLGCVVAISGAALPTLGYRETAASWAECPSGGGAVFMFGGVTGMRDMDGAMTEVLCYRDLPGVAGTVVAAGRLPGGRRSASATTVRAPGGGSRILVTGGFNSGRPTPVLDPLTDALLFDVDPCTCGPVRLVSPVAPLPMGYSGLPLLFDSATLADGSALIAGGLRLENLVTFAISGTDDSALFVPDVE